MAEKKDWSITFCENGDEYTGWMRVTAFDLKADEENKKVFVADGVRVELDEYIIDIREIP